MRDKFQRFMQGRYGADELCRFLTALGLILIVVNLFVRSGILSYVVLAILIYCYYRMFSRNYSRRYAEISELEKQAEIRTIQMEGGSGAEKGLSYLPVSVLQTENPRAQGKGKYYRDLPQVPHRISKEELRAACI